MEAFHRTMKELISLLLRFSVYVFLDFGQHPLPDFDQL